MEELERMMEEMAGMPKEDLGKRQPGEKCKYEEPFIPKAPTVLKFSKAERFDG